jgi:hypothetical protein
MECGWGTALYWNYDTFREEEAVVLYLGRKTHGVKVWHGRYIDRITGSRSAYKRKEDEL